ncbi:hypothetical protein TNCT_369901 [Trichonephila clavata]|uniref:Uncharacterized protein n=1 Tax=Trichonephila clavata TaxID=2740835 RepID=A0A8X6LIS3_TRICU|nr:hypothetical protein TNCT_369901 [Trichonephila clavata]
MVRQWVLLEFLAPFGEGCLLGEAFVCHAYRCCCSYGEKDHLASSTGGNRENVELDVRNNQAVLDFGLNGLQKQVKRSSIFNINGLEDYKLK